MQAIWNIIAIPLGYVMQWCYYLFDSILHMPLPYVFALFFFTLFTRILMFPLSIKQQKSSARMAVFTPMMNEINAKYKDDPNKKNEELQKLQKEYGFSPTAGCLPMLLQFPIILGLVEVIYKPLTFMIRIPAAVVTALSEKADVIVKAAGQTLNNRYIETKIIELVKTVPEQFTSLGVEGVSAADMSVYMDKIANINLSIGSINLWEIPKLAWSAMLLIPLFSIATMLVSSYMSMRTTSTDKNSMKSGMMMMGVSTLMFGYFSFTLPAGFSLYWGFGNIIAIGQSFILRKMYNPQKMKEQFQAEVEEKKRLAKEAKKVVVKTDTGDAEVKEMAADELARFRLQKAREKAETKYNS